jgi:hypothetical protein
VYAVSSSGQQLWKYATSGNPGTPVLGTGSGPLLFVASGDSFLYALYTPSTVPTVIICNTLVRYTVGSSAGTLAWRMQAPSLQGFTATPVTGSNGVSPLVFAGNSDGQLYAFFQFSGALAWNFSTFPGPDGSLQPITVDLPPPPPTHTHTSIYLTPLLHTEHTTRYLLLHLLLRQRRLPLRCIRFNGQVPVAFSYRFWRRRQSCALP